MTGTQEVLQECRFRKERTREAAVLQSAILFQALWAPQCVYMNNVNAELANDDGDDDCSNQALFKMLYPC